MVLPLAAVHLMAIPIILTAMLLLVGMLLRWSVPLFRWTYIPASVIAGLVGLLIVQVSADRYAAGETIGDLIASSATQWESWPVPLIAIVFAGMLLERKPAPLGQSLRRAGREGLMVWIIVLGQTTVGLSATWLVIGPWFGVPDAFGMLIETGFAGGHGTAAAMGQVFATERVGWEEGLDLGLMMATVGLVYGVLSGVVWINIGVRLGWTARAALEPSRVAGKPASTAELPRRSAILDPLLLQAIWLAIAFGIGMLMQWTVHHLAESIGAPPAVDGKTAGDPLAGRTDLAAVISSFPLFIYTLFGGLIVRRTLTSLGLDRLIDRDLINRLTSAAMDVLVVAAIASLNLSVVTQNAGSIAILILVAAVWTSFCLAVLARWILPRDHWFELGLINYGMSTGTTATGFVLLRMIDPELESGAAEDYALAAPMSSPFVGGGMLTIGMPLLVLGEFPLGWVVIALVAILTGLITIGVTLPGKPGRTPVD